MKNLFQVIGFFLLASQVHGQQRCDSVDYRINYIPITVSNNACTKQWGLTAVPTEYVISPYCDILFGCYMYDLYKNGQHIQRVHVANTHTFLLNYDQSGTYNIIITAKYISRSVCGWVIVVDNSYSSTLTSFCIPNASYSNANSGNGSLPAYTRTTDYIQTQNTVTVNANDNVAFYSQGTITLSPGFTAKKNSLFNAGIQACVSNATCQLRTASTELHSEDIHSEDIHSEDINPEEKDFSIYPNPVSDIINIKIANLNQHTGSIQMYNGSGEKIMILEDSSILQSMYEINAKNLPNGLYIIKIGVQNKEFIKKIIIQR
jgi:hypothetical protein